MLRIAYILCLTLLTLVCFATEFKLPNGGGGIVYYGNVTSNIVANANMTNQINSPLKVQSFTSHFFYKPVGTNSSIFYINESLDLGTNWVNVYSNTWSATTTYVFVSTNKFTDMQVILQATTTNLNWYFDHVGQ